MTARKDTDVEAGVLWILSLPVAACLILTGVFAADDGTRALVKVGRSVRVDNVWSGAPVGFAMKSRGDRQYVAYYDAQRRMTIAVRELESEKWTYHRLDEVVGWDSHNAVTFDFDRDGHIHLSGNMHGVPLKYFRTTRAEDITSFERVQSMTGANENRVTYPRFFKGTAGELMFAYRDGGSGNGSEIVNVYDESTRTWTRRIDRPLFDGQGKASAYYTGPARDSAGVYHVAWCWRDTPDCSTNHDVCYARSAGYRADFSRSDGTPIELPLTMDNAEVIDPVPVKSGLLNSVKLSFDSRDRVMVTYQKFDSQGNTQVYTARLENSGWKIYQTTDWTDRWEFSGGGTIPVMITYQAPLVWSSGRLCHVYRNKYHSPHTRIRFLDENTLRQMGEPVRLYPAEFESPRAAHSDDWQTNTSGVSLGALVTHGKCWALRWESTGPNRDRGREVEPPPSTLEVVELTLSDRP